MFAAMHIRRSTAFGSQRFGEKMATDLSMPGDRRRAVPPQIAKLLEHQ
jgi:hypothetical protein